MNSAKNKKAKELGVCAISEKDFCDKYGLLNDCSEEKQSDFKIENGTLISYTGKSPEVVIPEGIVTLGEDSFRDCKFLTNVTIPDSVTTIGDYAFSGCRGLTSIILPDSVTSIGDFAFSDCSSLTILTIGNSVISIGDDAVNCCKKISNVFYKGTLSEWKKIDISCENVNLVKAPRYYFSVTQPTEDGNYWHYDIDGKTPVVWEK